MGYGQQAYTALILPFYYYINGGVIRLKLVKNVLTLNQTLLTGVVQLGH